MNQRVVFATFLIVFLSGMAIVSFHHAERDLFSDTNTPPVIHDVPETSIIEGPPMDWDDDGAWGNDLNGTYIDEHGHRFKVTTAVENDQLVTHIGSALSMVVTGSRLHASAQFGNRIEGVVSPDLTTIQITNYAADGTVKDAMSFRADAP